MGSVGKLSRWRSHLDSQRGPSAAVSAAIRPSKAASQSQRGTDSRRLLASVDAAGKWYTSRSFFLLTPAQMNMTNMKTFTNMVSNVRRSARGQTPRSARHAVACRCRSELLRRRVHAGCLGKAVQANKEDDSLLTDVFSTTRLYSKQLQVSRRSNCKLKKVHTPADIAAHIALRHTLQPHHYMSAAQHQLAPACADSWQPSLQKRVPNTQCSPCNAHSMFGAPKETLLVQVAAVAAVLKGLVVQ